MKHRVTYSGATFGLTHKAVEKLKYKRKKWNISHHSGSLMAGHPCYEAFFLFFFFLFDGFVVVVVAAVFKKKILVNETLTRYLYFFFNLSF